MSALADFAVGQRVESKEGIGIVRYVGQADFAKGDWVGIELEERNGKNNGSVGGRQYFECEMAKGMFLRPTALTIIAQPVAAKRASRPSSVINTGAGRRLSSVPDPAAGKRKSMNAASPSPATRRPSSLRVSPKMRFNYAFLN